MVVIKLTRDIGTIPKRISSNLIFDNCVAKLDRSTLSMQSAQEFSAQLLSPVEGLSSNGLVTSW